ncbi:MAG: DUF2752 domain-containing protein [Salinivirgaceae bacterium]|nr:DUF2752 domain-containing protein [Salinivirgaceae bacterium]
MLTPFQQISFFANIANWIEKHNRPCFYKKHFDIECPGCGFQRSVIELLQGNIVESIKLYPALIPLILTFLVLLIHIKFRLKNGALIIKILFITSVILIVTNFIYKLIV